MTSQTLTLRPDGHEIRAVQCCPPPDRYTLPSLQERPRGWAAGCPEPGIKSGHSLVQHRKWNLLPDFNFCLNRRQQIYLSEVPEVFWTDTLGSGHSNKLNKYHIFVQHFYLMFIVYIFFMPHDIFKILESSWVQIRLFGGPDLARGPPVDNRWSVTTNIP